MRFRLRTRRRWIVRAMDESKTTVRDLEIFVLQESKGRIVLGAMR